MLKKTCNRERGSVTIEATISLSAFMFAIVTLLTVINICMVQAKMSIAINATAKEISQYSYLYALTGLHRSHGAISEGAEGTSEDLNEIIGSVNVVFTEIQNIGTGGESGENIGELAAEGRLEPDDLSTFFSNAEGSIENIEEAGGQLKETISRMAEDPKGVAFGLAKILASDGWDWAMSNLIAAPISKALCKKNLVAEKGGDVESYLKFLGVRPAANGSYLDGLDFSQSKLFPKGSNEICVNVSYDVNVIALLPINFAFHFNQTAITHGWLNGEESYRTTLEVIESEDTDSIWVHGSISERSSLIRKQGIKELIDEGYEQVAMDSFSDVHVYSPEKNEFAAIHSSNPLYSEEGESTKTLEDISEEAARIDIEKWCSGAAETASSVDKVYTKKTANGNTTKTLNECTDATVKVIIVIPEDEGLLEKYKSIVDSSNTHGVTVEIQQSYGNGARTTAKTDADTSEVVEGESE